jgi:hypothetical protein
VLATTAAHTLAPRQILQPSIAGSWNPKIELSCLLVNDSTRRARAARIAVTRPPRSVGFAGSLEQPASEGSLYGTLCSSRKLPETTPEDSQFR